MTPAAVTLGVQSSPLTAPEALVHTLIDDLAPHSFPESSPEPSRPPESLPLPDGGEPPEGGEPPAPPLSRWRRFFGHPAFRGALWLVGVLLALIAIGLLFPPNFWRF